MRSAATIAPRALVHVGVGCRDDDAVDLDLREQRELASRRRRVRA